MKKFMGITAITILFGALVYMIVADPHIPLLDADRNILAETEQEGYCAGKGYNMNQPQPEAVQDCLDTDPPYGTAIEHTAVQRAACVGVGVPSDQIDSCVEFLKGNQYWLTLDGRLTNSWNSRFPYPLADNLNTQEVGSNDRAGERNNNEREGLSSR